MTTSKQNKWVNSVVLSLFLVMTQSVIAIDKNKTVQQLTENPMSLSKKPSVGVYYYPWYRGSGRWFERNQWERVMRQHLKHPQAPKIGLYDSSDPKVIADHIEQSIRGRRLSLEKSVVRGQGNL